MPAARKKKKSKDKTSQSFEQYIRQHGEEEVVPFDDVLRKLIKKPSNKNKKQNP